MQVAQKLEIRDRSEKQAVLGALKSEPCEAELDLREAPSLNTACRGSSPLPIAPAGCSDGHHSTTTLPPSLRTPLLGMSSCKRHVLALR